MFIHLYSAINTGHQPRKKRDSSKCKTAFDLCMLINMIDCVFKLFMIITCDLSFVPICACLCV